MAVYIPSKRLRSDRDLGRKLDDYAAGKRAGVQYRTVGGRREFERKRESRERAYKKIAERGADADAVRRIMGD